VRVNLLEKFESRHTKREGSTLVVGSRIYGAREDRRKRYANATGVDMVAGEGVDWVCDLSQDDSFWESPQTQFAHVDCVSVLEHCAKPWLVARNIEELMVAKATMMLTVPFVWWVHSYPSDYWRFTCEAIRSIFPRIEWAELVYAHTGLAKDGKIPSTFVDEHRYFARSEVYGFGTRQ
jgi:hypothetical protein